jgi:hypothetical protein
LHISLSRQAVTLHGPSRAVIAWIYIAGGLLYVAALRVSLRFAVFLWLGCGKGGEFGFGLRAVVVELAGSSAVMA